MPSRDTSQAYRERAYSNTRCVHCGQPATKLCDGSALPGVGSCWGGAKTCDKNLCDRCATPDGPGRDLCKDCAAQKQIKPV
jgi:hypothetical protein